MLLPGRGMNLLDEPESLPFAEFPKLGHVLIWLALAPSGGAGDMGGTTSARPSWAAEMFLLTQRARRTRPAGWLISPPERVMTPCRPTMLTSLELASGIRGTGRVAR